MPRRQKAIESQLPLPGVGIGELLGPKTKKQTRVRACWCGETNPYYAPLRRRCGGHGKIDCICGGDFCVCHNHGTVECFGCPDCEGDDDRDDYRDDE